jgi:hypothetical protein
MGETTISLLVGLVSIFGTLLGTPLCLLLPKGIKSTTTRELDGSRKMPKAPNKNFTRGVTSTREFSEAKKRHLFVVECSSRSMLKLIAPTKKLLVLMEWLIRSKNTLSTTTRTKKKQARSTTLSRWVAHVLFILISLEKRFQHNTIRRSPTAELASTMHDKHQINSRSMWSLFVLESHTHTHTHTHTQRHFPLFLVFYVHHQRVDRALQMEPKILVYPNQNPNSTTSQWHFEVLVAPHPLYKDFETLLQRATRISGVVLLLLLLPPLVLWMVGWTWTTT